MQYPRILEIQNKDDKFIFLFESGSCHEVWEPTSTLYYTEASLAGSCQWPSLELMEEELTISEALAFLAFSKRELFRQKNKEFYEAGFEDRKEIWQPVYDHYQNFLDL